MTVVAPLSPDGAFETAILVDAGITTNGELLMNETLAPGMTLGAGEAA